jgi:CBS domain-containing protein
MIGGALGALFAPVLPGMSSGEWALVGMTAVLSGSIGCPLTAAVLSLELTHNYNLLLPVFTASVVAHAFTVLFQKRSILTERISRRGYHLSREYSVDPLETIMVAEAVRPRVVVLPAELTSADAQKWLDGGQILDGRRAKSDHCGQRLYPLVDVEGRLTGVITRSGLSALANSSGRVREASPAESPVVAYPDETLRAVAERMASRRIFVLPVVERDSGKLLGLVNAEDVLAGRTRAHERETRYERLRMPFRWSRRRAAEVVKETV